MNSKLLDKLISLVPEKVIFIDVSSQRPQEIVDQLNLLSRTNPSDSVLCFNSDVWRYQNHSTLVEYFNQDRRRFYITTLGYENKKMSHNVFELSFPYFYFKMDRTETVVTTSNRDYGFSCLNNNSSFHRIVLGHDLYKNGLLSDMIFSQNKTQWPSGNLKTILDGLSHIKNYTSLLPIKWINETHSNYAADHSIDHDAYQRAYCNITTESEIQDFVYEGPVVDLPIITEKSYKPFRSKQVPLFFVAKGHMRYLKNLGFEVMEDLVPSDYDSMGVFDKSSAIVEIVKKGRGYIENFYHDHLKEIQHNFDLIYRGNLEQQIFSSIKNFLSKELV